MKEENIFVWLVTFSIQVFKIFNDLSLKNVTNSYKNVLGTLFKGKTKKALTKH